MTFGEKWRKDLLNKWISKASENEIRYYFFTKKYKLEDYFQDDNETYSGYTATMNLKGNIVVKVHYEPAFTSLLHHYDDAKIVNDKRILKKLERLKLKEMFREVNGPVA